MTRPTSVVLALAMVASLALAVDNNWFNWNTFRQFDYDDTPTGERWGIFYRKLIALNETTAVIIPRDTNPRWCGNLRYGPPGHQHKALPYAELWGYAVAESGLGWSATECDVQWRWRMWYPGDYSTIYHGAWTPIFTVIGATDTLFAGPIWSPESLGWFNDIEFRAWGGISNDSTYLSFGVMRRTWK